jgi:hypothetical protein
MNSTNFLQVGEGYLWIVSRIYPNEMFTSDKNNFSMAARTNCNDETIFNKMNYLDLRNGGYFKKKI